MCFVRSDVNWYSLNLKIVINSLDCRNMRNIDLVIIFCSWFKEVLDLEVNCIVVGG